MKFRFLMLAFAAVILFDCHAQTVQIVDDEEKRKIWQSMEGGEWGFSPGFYYWLLHKNYSGASLKGFSVKFDAGKSNVGQIAPVRITAAATQNIKRKEAKKEKERIHEPYKEDLANHADRVVDVSYTTYKDEFNRMQDIIEEGLLICMNRSRGEMHRAVEEIMRKNSIVCENISYIHDTRVDSQLSNSRRQKAYEEAKAEMQTLVNRTVHLTALAVTLYK